MSKRSLNLRDLGGIGGVVPRGLFLRSGKLSVLTVFDEFNIAWTTWCYDADFGFWDQQRNCYKDYPLVELLMSGKKLGE